VNYAQVPIQIPPPILFLSRSPQVSCGSNFECSVKDELLRCLNLLSLRSEGVGFFSDDRLNLVNKEKYLLTILSVNAFSLSVLEGIALSTDPNYKVLSSSYPWIARKVLTDSSPQLRETLKSLLYKVRYLRKAETRFWLLRCTYDIFTRELSIVYNFVLKHDAFLSKQQRHSLPVDWDRTDFIYGFHAYGWRS
jgi:predicted unusual protein kinase regulating ubiquinone biosynthesis (AarF/ABC1/UbiB family)